MNSSGVVATALPLAWQITNVAGWVSWEVTGIFENIGETGWQLSHGERARIYLARALLQNADVTIIDESFGTLDPHNHHTALAAALHHTRATILIAHP